MLNYSVAELRIYKNSRITKGLRICSANLAIIIEIKLSTLIKKYNLLNILIINAL